IVAWQFAAEFPRTTRLGLFDRVYPATVAAVATICGFVFIGNWLDAVLGPPFSTYIEPVRRSGYANGFWILNVSLTLPALAASAWRVRRAPSDERRRVLWFVAALFAAILPLTLFIAATALSASFRALLDAPNSTLLVIEIAVIGSLIAMPLTTAYALLAHRTLSVRLFAHQIVRYSFARTTLTVLMATPLIVPIAAAFAHPEMRVGELVTLRSFRWALWGAVFGAGALASRRLVVARIDRWFGHQVVDVARTLAAASEQIGIGRTAREVGFAMVGTAREALGASNVGVLLRDGDGDYLAICGISAILPAGSAVVALLAEEPTVAVDPGTWLYGVLPDEDRRWLTHHNVATVARISVRGQECAGILTLGRRRSRLPYGSNELELIGALVATAGIALRRISQANPEVTLVDVGAVECPRCGRVAREKSCECPAGSRAALLPTRLGDRFDVVRRLGHGGMGVVYLARDTRLDRDVALKTLPSSVTASPSVLLSEARTMAGIEHGNVASIYDLLTWEDTPVLVVEYLPNGTLAERLTRGPVGEKSALSVGIALADGLAELHAAGILHRDIKPSNVGFAKSGTPKLLDFGIARLLGQSGLSETSALAGTPLYLSPDLLDGAAPTPQDDIWALSLAIFEAATGEFPFQGRTVAQFRRSMEYLDAGCTDRLSPSFSHCLTSLLHPDRRRRPASAAALSQRLREEAGRLTPALVEVVDGSV
ncbi:MAG TPA: serine/threonine-protein kinase, partial [Vicinamibacterales bacterium]|nr:serine/threonine-protein kinase [Vicinamibacterales bacterium]